MTQVILTPTQELAVIIRKNMQCNCDLDNWQPNISTGHSDVCRIHKATMLKVKENDSKNY